MTEETHVTTTIPTAKRLPLWVMGLSFAGLLAFLALIAWGMNRNQAGPITIGEKVPAFSLTTFGGQVLKTADYSGKVVVINFWASWCQPCEQEADSMEQAWQVYKPGGQVVFLGVDYVDTEPQALGFIKRFSVSYPNGPDLRTVISQMFHTTGVPETYILDRQGKLAYVKKGPFMSVVEITSVVDGLVK
jgi:cytochrome c biogenesis protein CcmG, thiol:disulfide interchange protein DsbE